MYGTLALALSATVSLVLSVLLAWDLVTPPNDPTIVSSGGSAVYDWGMSIVMIAIPFSVIVLSPRIWHSTDRRGLLGGSIGVFVIVTFASGSPVTLVFFTPMILTFVVLIAWPENTAPPEEAS